ncbi:MAG: M48 family metallopeptidase [Pseudomonadota bacterium]
MTFQADYFDGVSARAQPVLVRVLADVRQIAFEVNGETLSFAFKDCDVQARLGASKRLIDLTNGGRLEAQEITTLESLLSSKASALGRALHYLESHLAWVLLALVLTVFAGWGFLQFGVPRLAEVVAKATPASMESKLGEQVLNGLDHKYGYFSPSKTALARQSAITAALKDLCMHVNNCPDYRLTFRDGGMIGANAFALPGGVMVVTDDLVTLSKNDTEIVAVLAHELGHVQQRHAFRQSIQGVLAGLIIAAITGDVSSVASGLPAVLMQMQYSREHELEADGFALDALQKACLPPRAFADILQRLENQASLPADPASSKKTAESQANKPANSQKNHSFNDMLSSHPDTQRRIQPFLQAESNAKRHCR